jgi:two-component system response regulator YesN
MHNTILIVDDEPEIREMLSRNFKLGGYNTATAENGKKALEYLSSHPVDVVISDIIMPVMDGVTLLRKIRIEFPMVHVIMITGYVTLENALACMRHQADTCVFKPFSDMQELEDSVAKAMETIKNWNQKFKELQGMKETE